MKLMQTSMQEQYKRVCKHLHAMPDKIARFDMYALVGVRLTQVFTPPPNSEKFASPVPFTAWPACTRKIRRDLGRVGTK